MGPVLHQVGVGRISLLVERDPGDLEALGAGGGDGGGAGGALLAGPLDGGGGLAGEGQVQLDALALDRADLALGEAGVQGGRDWKDEKCFCSLAL